MDNWICGTPVTTMTKGQYVLEKLGKITVGDTTFKIRKDVLDPSPNFIEIACYEKLENEEVIIYVETTEYDSGHVSDQDIATIASYLTESTPPSAINPDLGILDILRTVYGNFPDVDGNGKIIVLLIDVRDDYSQGSNSSYVAGYFDPYDQQTNYGNYGDIIYIDTNPAIASSQEVLSTVAHELQHLIHYRYDKNEAIWLNEALSELAPRLCGLPTRSFGRYLARPGASLTRFDNTLYDYSKVALFSFYLYQQYGQGLISALVEDGQRQGLNSLDWIVQNNVDPLLSAREIYRNWTIANTISNLHPDETEYSYQGPDLPQITPNLSYASLPVEEQSCFVQRYGAQYLLFSGGADISFNLSHEETYGLDLIVIKILTSPIVTVNTDIISPFQFSDPDFGVTYEQVYFIPCFFPLSRDSTEIFFSATGRGGFQERTIRYDNEDITYISLDGMTAATFFPIDLNAGESLTQIEVNLLYNRSSTIGIVQSLSSEPVYLKTISTGGGWIKIDIPEHTLSSTKRFYVTVFSSDNALGYSDYMSGEGISYLKVSNTSSFRPLSDFSTSEGQLTGNWAIRATLRIPLKSHLLVSPIYLNFWTDADSLNLYIQNKGAGVLHWKVLRYPSWLSVSPESGEVFLETDTLNLKLNRNLMQGGNYSGNLTVSDDDSGYAVYLSAVIPNPVQPQLSLNPSFVNFDSTSTIKAISIVNTGYGVTDWMVDNPYNFITLSNYSGVLYDSSRIFLYLDRDFLSLKTGVFSMRFQGEENSDTLRFMIQKGGSEVQESPKLSTLNIFKQPFYPRKDGFVNIIYRLEKPARTRLLIYNLLGELIYQHDFGFQEEGIYATQWDGKNRRGKAAASGIYIVRIKAGERSFSSKLTLLR